MVYKALGISKTDNRLINMITIAAIVFTFLILFLPSVFAENANDLPHMMASTILNGVSGVVSEVFDSSGTYSEFHTMLSGAKFEDVFGDFF